MPPMRRVRLLVLLALVALTSSVVAKDEPRTALIDVPCASDLVAPPRVVPAPRSRKGAPGFVAWYDTATRRARLAVVR